MPLAEHLKEARSRVIRALLGLVVGAVIGWLLYPYVFEAIMAPLAQLREQGREAALNFGTIGSAFDTQMRISVFLGVFVSSPWWVYQIWAFVTPGLTRTERRYTMAFALAGTLLFVTGGAIGWMIMPHAVQILTSFTPETALNLMDARVYFTFFTRLVLAFGIAFLLPLVLVGLNMVGVVRGAAMLRQWRWAVVVSFTFTAFANPLPDAWSMIAMAIPLIALYFVACWIAIRHDKAADARAAREDAELDAALAAPTARTEPGPPPGPPAPPGPGAPQTVDPRTPGTEG